MPKAKTVKKETAKKEVIKPVIYKAYAVLLEDEYGNAVYTFLSKRERDAFFERFESR